MKRFLIKLSKDDAKRNKSLEILKGLGIKVELCLKLINIYVVEIDEKSVNLLNNVPDIELKEEDEYSFGISI